MSRTIKNIFSGINGDEFIATAFGLGNLPLAPGTWGSLGGLLLCLALHPYPVWYILVFAAIFLAGVRASGRVEKGHSLKDPSYVVIDEFACIFIVFIAVPMHPFYLAAGFALFRLFDILKIPPMKKIEKIKGGWGIMLDDAVAAAYANLVLQVFRLAGL
ncbi:MAG: phosphatidylglycerophosphatase A [Candidatus Omnitrophica bacterium]|nr:phosphatidylglycerophosphatase A [Candidatus Omnitrophota bacterium]